MPAGIEEVANELGALAKRIYDTGVLDQEQRLTPTYDAIPSKNWNIKGDGWYGDAHLKRSSSYKFTNPKEALPQDTYEISKQFLIRNVEMQGTVTFTKDFLMKLVGGVTSFEDYTYKIEDLHSTMKKNLNQACYIGPTMTRAILSNSPAAATTGTVDNVQYLHVGMFVDIYDTTGATLIESNVEITGVSTLTLTFGRAITATATDIIFLHEENVGTTNGKGFNGLPNQADDGTAYDVTFEGLSRTTYPAWRGVYESAGGAALTNDFLQKMQNAIREQGGNDYQTEDYVNFVHLDSVRRYISIVLPQKRYIDASKYDAGIEKPIENALEWNGKGIIVDSDAPKNSWLMINRAHSGKMEIAPLGVESMLGGTSMKWRSGYVQGVVVSYYSGALGNNKPNSCAIGVSLAAVA